MIANNPQELAFTNNNNQLTKNVKSGGNLNENLYFYVELSG